MLQEQKGGGVRQGYHMGEIMKDTGGWSMVGFPSEKKVVDI